MSGPLRGTNSDGTNVLRLAGAQVAIVRSPQAVEDSTLSLGDVIRLPDGSLAVLDGYMGDDPGDDSGTD